MDEAPARAERPSKKQQQQQQQRKGVLGVSNGGVSKEPAKGGCYIPPCTRWCHGTGTGVWGRKHRMSQRFGAVHGLSAMCVFVYTCVYVLVRVCVRLLTPTQSRGFKQSTAGATGSQSPCIPLARPLLQAAKAADPCLPDQLCLSG